jgi:hypothetical protein
VVTKAEVPKLTMIPSSNQAATSHDLMNDIREVINLPKYDHMTVATLLGTLDFVKMHYYAQAERDV